MSVETSNLPGYPKPRAVGMKSVSVSVSVRKLPVRSTTGLPSLRYLYVREMSMGGRSIRNYVGMYSYEVPSATECMVAVVKLALYTECPVSEDINGPTYKQVVPSCWLRSNNITRR